MARRKRAAGPSGAPSSPPKGKSKIRKLAAVGFGLLLAGLLLLAMLVFSSRPVFPLPALGPKDWKFQSDLLMRELPKLLNAKPGDFSTIELSPDDVRSLLAFAANGVKVAELFSMRSGGGGDHRKRDWQAKYRNGQFELDYFWDSGIPLLFGGGVALHFTGTADFADDRLIVLTSAARIGRIPVHPALLDGILRRIIADQHDGKNFKRFRQAVREIGIDPKTGRITIVYQPAAVRSLILKK
jgi:hypothetical protein